MASWTYVIHILSILLTLCLKLHLKYTSTRSEQISPHCLKKSSYTTLIHLYVFINSLTIVDFLWAHLHAFIKLVDPIRKQQEWAALLREGSWELGAEGDTRLTGQCPHHQTMRAEQVQWGSAKSSGVPRQICRGQPRPRKRQQEKPERSGWDQESQVRAQAHLHGGSGEELGQGLSWDGLLSQGAEGDRVSPRWGSSWPLFAGLFAQLSAPWLRCPSTHLQQPQLNPQEAGGQPAGLLGALRAVTGTGWSVVGLLGFILHVLCLASYLLLKKKLIPK